VVCPSRVCNAGSRSSVTTGTIRERGALPGGPPPAFFGYYEPFGRFVRGLPLEFFGITSFLWAAQKSPGAPPGCFGYYEDFWVVPIPPPTALDIGQTSISLSFFSENTATTRARDGAAFWKIRKVSTRRKRDAKRFNSRPFFALFPIA
jgi:hypothetical protein